MNTSSFHLVFSDSLTFLCLGPQSRRPPLHSLPLDCSLTSGVTAFSLFCQVKFISRAILWGCFWCNKLVKKSQSCKGDVQIQMETRENAERKWCLDVSAAVCLHLNKSICSTCTYEWVWKPYSVVLVQVILWSYVTFVWREENTFCLSSGFFETLFIIFPQITLEMTFVFIELCALAFVPRFSSLHCHVLSSCTYSLLTALSMQCCTNATSCVANLSLYWFVSLLFDSLSEIHHKVSLIRTLLQNVDDGRPIWLK